MQPTLKTLASGYHCTYALMGIGIYRLSSLLNDNHIIDGNKLTSLFGRNIKTKHIMALNRLSHALNNHNLTEVRTDHQYNHTESRQLAQQTP
eukprot:1161395-Pelagomonas_calceolata.AAC.3